MTDRRHTKALDHLTNFDPAAVARAATEACTEIHFEPLFNNTNAMREDPAVRLLAYRLALICDVHVPNVPEYDRLVDACQELERRAKAGG